MPLVRFRSTGSSSWPIKGPALLSGLTPANLQNTGNAIYLQADKVLLGVQGAIWEIEYGGTVSNTGAYSALINGYISSFYTAAIGLVSGPNAPGFYDTLQNTQGFVLAGGTSVLDIPVPEPAMWTMLLVGFFGTGFMLRRSRRNAASVCSLIFARP